MAIRRGSSRLSSTCRSCPQAADCAGGWPAITVARLKVGELTQLISVGANPVRVVHRLLPRHPGLVPRRHPALCRPHRQALTLRPRLLRHLAQPRDTQPGLQGVCITGRNIQKKPKCDCKKPDMSKLTRRSTTNKVRLEFIERNDVIHFCNLLFVELMILILDLYLRRTVAPGE